MAKLKLYHQGELLNELELNPGEEYFAGRSSQCQFLLTHDRGISRQHIKIVHENGVWTVHLMSRFGGLIYAGKPIDMVTLDTDCRFSVPPYEFEFTVAEAAQEAEPIAASPVSDEPLPVEQKSPDFEAYPFEAEQDQPNEVSQEAVSEDTSGGNFEATQMAVSSIVPFLRILNRASGHEEILKLEGQLWIAGRHPSSEIYINDNSISRKHFEIAKTNEGFFITDQNSSNGTTINDDRIPSGEPRRLMSGDVITIRNIQIIFEVHDLGFDQKIKNLPAPVDNSNSYETEYDDRLEVSNAIQPISGINEYQNGPAVIKLPSAGPENPWQKNKFKVALGGLLIVLLAAYFMPEEMPSSDGQNLPVDGSTEMATKKQLSPQKMAEIKDKYELAKKNYQERGNYTLCRDLLMEIHNEVPSYEDSQNLQKFCEQGIELSLIKNERDMKEQKRAEAESKINSTVANCQSQYNDTVTLEKMQECLQVAIELDPQNSGSMELLERIKIRDQERESKAEAEKNTVALATKGREHFKRAVSLESRGQLRQALNEFTSFLGKNYPGLQTQEENARRSIASIKQNLNQKISERVSSCRLYVEKSEFKSALKACKEALRDDPKNTDALELKERAENEMRRGLKSVYEDSVLEESMGNIESAKDKWKTIMGNSYPGENFYEKAKSRLKKYGG